MKTHALNIWLSKIFKPLQKIYNYTCHRWLYKRHALTSNLKRGQWHDFDARLLHAAFDELVNFVEIELAAQHLARLNKKLWKSFLPRQRFPEMGVAALQWTAQLKNDEEWVAKNDHEFGQPTSEALAAKEILALYSWWIREYPKRADPNESTNSTYYQIQEARTKEETEMLIRLIEIRQYIWT